MDGKMHRQPSPKSVYDDGSSPGGLRLVAMGRGELSFQSGSSKLFVERLPWHKQWQNIIKVATAKIAKHWATITISNHFNRAAPSCTIIDQHYISADHNIFTGSPCVSSPVPP